MLGIMAGMDQKVCCETALVVGSGMSMGGFAGFFTSRWVPFPGVQAQMLGIMAGVNQKDFFAFLFLQWHVPGWYSWCTLCSMFPSFFGRLVMLGITAGMDQKEGYVAPCRKLLKIRSCSSSTRSSSSSSWCRG